ncbi:divalent-cation tolerance protein CutA [Pseudoalteromonas sp. 13-15]|jgi:periplasmic divalent cation tolerance protein|uniref:Divalent-cation tolerance protein CutA n=1 Tax=Pseudoalteromonas marina TaxID=267375 RepID=A0ABT9FGT8_9GAMM|nr:MULTISPECIES: divalent-cation tolerance protein CutA [Pseudoalteromonas]EAW29420.1 periplasmic divalent cation tolerance protein (C-type cytochrome biogenesis protein) [Alteromonadales bacterium TW-7]ATG56984.1 divalent-cation tolerance protein CutA [Pseudoalteromonas marina]AUL73918.1 divalent-cation tolerance protein CutA [Pseudoalteromonas sp. 13-15]KAF7777284.1 periplasmic divalent cation tolerance protein [Pseudoalteromonas marina]MCK8121873.1 divalent-cation tolerance protein CutA [Ps|tara:strand:- start:60 stop:380 length:321 start_codon:yes stop_codon:yes gene_type:complete
MNTQFKLIFTTCKNEAEARMLGKALVEKKLAACVNILPAMSSIYMWEGEVKEMTEVKMLVKTKTEKMNDVFLTIKAMHSYEVPEIQVIDITTGNLAYFNWMDEVLH